MNTSSPARAASASAHIPAQVSVDRASAKKRTRLLKAVPVLSFRERVAAFLDGLADQNPCLIIDLNVVRQNYQGFTAALPQSKVYYAVKANPAPEILKLLTDQGSCFDVASPGEIDLVLSAGADASRISYGNTIKKERDIAYAHEMGVTLFAVDSILEVEKVARAAPGARVYCRLLVDNEGAEWPLSRKFGCEPAMAVEVMDAAKSMGLVPMGLSFHVGSQQPNTNAWDMALNTVVGVFKELDARGIALSMINMGGGFPAKYLKDIPTVKAYGKAINASLRKHFGANVPETIIEPGRGMVGDAGILRAEVVLVSKKSVTDELPWVYLDIGKFTGLAETIDESIRYPITTLRDADPKVPCIVAGPTCDSVDVLYEKNPYSLPKTLQPGDVVWIESAGAYTTSYASTGFNGFAPPKTYCIEAL